MFCSRTIASGNPHTFRLHWTRPGQASASCLRLIGFLFCRVLMTCRWITAQRYCHDVLVFLSPWDVLSDYSTRRIFVLPGVMSSMLVDFFVIPGLPKAARSPSTLYVWLVPEISSLFPCLDSWVHGNVQKRGEQCGGGSLFSYTICVFLYTEKSYLQRLYHELKRFKALLSLLRVWCLDSAGKMWRVWSPKPNSTHIPILLSLSTRTPRTRNLQSP